MGPHSTKYTYQLRFLLSRLGRLYPNWYLDDLENIIEPVGLHISRDPLFLTQSLCLGRLHLQPTIPTDPDPNTLMLLATRSSSDPGERCV